MRSSMDEIALDERARLEQEKSRLDERVREEKGREQASRIEKESFLNNIIEKERVGREDPFVDLLIK
jgi:hypothetical protein